MDLTVYHDGQFLLESLHVKKREIVWGEVYFGAEPSDEEVLMFVNGSLLEHFQHFAKCGVEVKENSVLKHKAYHTTSAKETTIKRFTKAQEAISLSYELHKQEKKLQSKEKREAEKKEDV